MKTIAFLLGGMVMMSGIGALLSAKGIDEEKSFTLDGLEGIRTELDAINLHVTPAESSAVTVRLYGSALHELRLAADVENGVLVVEVRRHRRLPIYEKVAVDITVPRAGAHRLSLTTGSSSGNVELGSLELAGYSHRSSSGRLTSGDLVAERVSVRTTSGSVGMGRLEAGRLELAGSSANITVDGCRAREAVVETTSGNVALHNSSGTVRASSRSGNVLIDYASFTRQDATIETTSGSAKLELPAGAEFSLDARTTSGRIRCEFPVGGEGHARERHLSGSIGREPNRVSIQTTSGGLSILKK